MQAHVTFWVTGFKIGVQSVLYNSEHGAHKGMSALRSRFLKCRTRHQYYQVINVSIRHCYDLIFLLFVFSACGGIALVVNYNFSVLTKGILGKGWIVRGTTALLCYRALLPKLEQDVPIY